MSRLAFDPSKWARWFLPFPKPRLPITAGVFDEPKTCIGINQEWAVLITAAMDVLADGRMWETTDQAVLWFLEQQARIGQGHILRVTGCDEDCPECPECPEPEPCPGCPEPEPEVPTNTPVGNLGFTIEELEEMVMGCINIASMLKFENGFLWVKDDCCNWVKITGQVSPVLTTQSPAAGNAATTFSGWQQQGFPALSEQPAVQHTNSAYNTLDSLRCAKATALTEALWNYLDSDRQLILSASEGDSITELAAQAIGFFLGVPSTVILSFVTSMKTATAGMNATDYSEELLEILDSDETKSQVICILTDRVTAPINFGGLLLNRVTDNDLQQLVTTFNEVTGASEEVESRVNATLLAELASRTVTNLDEIECGCVDKLPHGYVPIQSGNNRLNFSQIASATRDDDTAYNTALGRSVALEGLEFLQHYSDAVSLGANIYKPIRQFRANTDRGHLGGGVLYKFEQPILVNQLIMRIDGQLSLDARSALIFSDGDIEHQGSALTNNSTPLEQTLTHNFSSPKETEYIWVHYMQRSGTGQPYPTAGEFELMSLTVASESEGQISIVPNVQFAD